jgi:hypothetical protein
MQCTRPEEEQVLHDRLRHLLANMEDPKQRAILIGTFQRLIDMFEEEALRPAKR